MLTGILIRNYLFVPEQKLDFGPGMTVLSGETGAGKSILVGSISLIFGDPSPALEPYDKELPIYLEASFDISGNTEVLELLSEQGHHPDAELCLAREVSTAGKSTYYLGGRKVSSGLLKELKPLLIDFHHQRDQQLLLAPAYQLRLLDLYARNDKLRENFATLYRSLRSYLKELERLKAEEEANLQLRELYQYHFDELEKAGLRAGEDRELQQEFDLLSHAREISETAGTAALELYDSENSVYARLSQAIARLGRYSPMNEEVARQEQSLRDAQEAISESSSALASLSAGISADPARLEQISERLDAINNLLHKHKAQSIGELLDIFAQREAQINAFADLSQRIVELEALISKDFIRLKEAGDKLSASRARAGDKLSAELQEAIRALSIPDARFKISIDKKAEGKNILPEYLESCSDQGQDACQFFFSANRGSELRLLSAVASGGELSRILLAMKKVLSERIEEKLIILDEIDAGIGGKTAESVAQFIFRLAQRHRILCITHLAQIAAIAHQQVALRKESGKKKSLIRMLPLNDKERLEELARMLSGDLSAVSLKHAEELINKYRT